MSNVYSDALEAWKNAHAQLKTALAVYSDACSTLCSLCSGPLVQNTTKLMLENVLAALDSDIPELVAPDVEQVTSANWSVKLLRNKSTTLVRINTLPAELLTRIFELLCYSHEKLGEVDQLSRSPWALACVSTYWRQLTVSNSYLWARIHMPTWDKRRGKPHEQMRKQLTYARTSPLDAIIDIDEMPVNHIFAQETENLFVESAPRLRSLTYYSPGYRFTSYLPNDFLSYWIQHETPGNGYHMKLLSYSPVTSGDIRLDIQPSLAPMERIEEFLASIQYLALHHHYVEWSSTLYHGLIELDLSFGPSFVQFPTASEFAAILSASPGLRALKLHGFGLQLQDSLDAVEPIRLDYLGTLFLGDIHRRSRKLLLSMFQPGSTPLYMRLNLPKQSVDIAHYAQLLQRSSVVKLMIVGNGLRLSRSILASLAGVRCLCLCNFVLDISFWMSMHELLIPYANEEYPSVWPSLQILHLFECVFHVSDYKRDPNKSIPYNFMLWIWVADQFNEMNGSHTKRDSFWAQNVLGSFPSYVPGIQEAQDDKSILLEAWGSALDFAPYSISSAQN
ncbi:hypothetical protein FRC12_023822 [Ceratobasidium sp. 428]|nr:hypothetical protein FRC12_023822 [Ceratobasidium sp. 428]